MHTNITNNGEVKVGLIYPELSYCITGICFDIHNELGRFSREKQYCDTLEKKFAKAGIPYLREYRVGDTGNIADFLVDHKIILEVKAKDFSSKEDYYQVQRYLQAADKRLGLLVNFRNWYIKPARIVKIDVDRHNK